MDTRFTSRIASIHGTDTAENDSVVPLGERMLNEAAKQWLDNKTNKDEIVHMAMDTKQLSTPSGLSELQAKVYQFDLTNQRNAVLVSKLKGAVETLLRS